MRLNEYIEQQRAMLDAFKIFWEHSNEPAELEAGDWDEQFAFFQDSYQ